MRLLGGRVRGKQSRCAARRKSAEANKLGQVTPDSTASERRFRRSYDEASDATLKSRLSFSQERAGRVEEFNETPPATSSLGFRYDNPSRK